MEKKNHIKVRFSTILLCIPVILLCTAPCDGAFFSLNYSVDDEYDGDEYFVTEDLVNDIRAANNLGVGGLDSLDVGAGTTVHLYTSVKDSVQTHPGSILNIHSGSVGYYVILSTGEPNPVVTVYGTNFAAKEGGALNPSSTQFTVDNVNGGVLTGTYENGDPIELKFVSNIPIYLKEADVSEVKIDIKPGGNPNNINLRSKGVVPVAILSTETFNASNVDPESVTFAGAEPERWKLEDVDEDGDLDMLFHFKTEYLVDLDEDSTKATLTATLIDTSTKTMGITGGEVIQGTDEVCIKPGKKK